MFLTTRCVTVVAAAGVAATLGSGCMCGGGATDDVVGNACTANFDCVELCAEGAQFPGGFCTTRCTSDLDCPADTVCANVKGGTCHFPCDSSAYCADLLEPGYECQIEAARGGGVVSVCSGGSQLGPGPVPPAPDSFVGGFCNDNSDCVDFCAWGGSFPFGFCTTNCFSNADCSADSWCADAGGPYGFVCLFPCGSDSYCEAVVGPGFECRDRETPFGGEVDVCLGD